MLRKIGEEEKRLWAELSGRDFDPERSDALPDVVLDVVRREFLRLIWQRAGIVATVLCGVALLGFFYLTSYRDPLERGVLCVLALGLVIAMLAFLFTVPPSRRWLNAVLLIVDLSSDLTPDAVVRCLLHFGQMDRHLRYKKNSYSQLLLHKTLEDAMVRAKDFVATEEECAFLLEIVRNRARYPRGLRIAALNAVAPPGIALTDSLRRQVQSLTTSSAVGDTLKSQARELLRRS